MVRTYREIAVQEMLRTVEEAMSQVIDWWGDLPPPMRQAIEQFRTNSGSHLIPKNLLKGHSTDKYTKLTAGKPSLMFTAVHLSSYVPDAKWQHVRCSVVVGGKADHICSM